MLHLIPPPLHRRLYRIAYWARSLYWRTVRPTVHGCRIVALDEAGRVLLIRQSYGPRHWLTPGGSVESGEDPVTTAARELDEETGCSLADPRKVTELLERPMGAYNVVHVVVGRAGGREQLGGRLQSRPARAAGERLAADRPPRAQVDHRLVDRHDVPPRHDLDGRHLDGGGHRTTDGRAALAA